MANATTAPAASDVDIAGLMSGLQWDTTRLTFSFPSRASHYGMNYGLGEPGDGFKAVPLSYRKMVRDVLNEYGSVSNLIFTEIIETNSNHADIRFGTHNPSGSSVHAYYPGLSSGGDIWLNNTPDLLGPIIGTSLHHAFIHEIGHALGLKHGHEDPQMSNNHNSKEYSNMTYIDYVGGTSNFFSIDKWSRPQSLMMYDIAAIQHMYGTNYNFNATSTSYRWDPDTGVRSTNEVSRSNPGDNIVFETIWDGGGKDVYDFSLYKSSVNVNLRPGFWTKTSEEQLAELAQFPESIFAIGNIANSLLHNGDLRSIIENAIGGSGDDLIEGNIVKNEIIGGPGDDTMDGGLGSDGILGQIGDDVLVGSEGHDTGAGGAGADIVVGNQGRDLLSGGVGDDRIFGGIAADRMFGGDGNDVLDGGAGADAISTGLGTDTILLTGSAWWGDQVVDFEDNKDRLRFWRSTIESFDDLEIIENGSAKVSLEWEGKRIILLSDQPIEISERDVQII